MAITQRMALSFEAPTYSAANLNGQDGHVDRGSGAHQATVTATTPITGSQSVTFTNGGTTTVLGIDRAIGYTRVAAEEWVGVWQVKCLATWVAGSGFDIGLCKGNFDPAAYSTTAIDIAVIRSATAGKVDIWVWDNANPLSGDPQKKLAQFSMGTTGIAFRLRIFADDTYVLEIDTANLRESWVQVTTGSLITANKLFSRYFLACDGDAFTSTTVFFDEIYFSTVTASTKVSLGRRPIRYGAVTTAAADGDNVKITYTIYDRDTGATLSAGRDVYVPAAYLDPTDDKEYTARIDHAISEDMKAYDKTARIALLAASGHGVDF